MFRLKSKNVFTPITFYLGMFVLTTSAFAGIPASFDAVAPETDSLFVINFANKSERLYFQELNLDQDHPNLLAPGLPPEEFNAVRSSWATLHQRLGDHLKAKGFDWGVADDNISIVHKIYFTPAGTVEKYCFKVMNKDVSFARTEAFSTLAEAFFQEERIDLARPSQFAQCGKTRYPNITPTAEEEEE